MMDPLENKIRKNKDAFDDLKVDKMALWETIEKELPGTKVKIIPLWKRVGFRVAASVILLIGVALSMVIIKSRGSKDLYASSQELMDVNNHYEEIIQMKVMQISRSESLSKEDKEEFMQTMNDLDREYEKLKNELTNNLDNRLILDAIILHYRKRIDMLEDFIDRMNRSHKKKEIGNEFITI
jgi:hypothetical protein